MKITVLTIDLAKDVFQLHGNDAQGHCVLKRRLRRSELTEFMVNLPTCVVAMGELWQQEMQNLHRARSLMVSQRVAYTNVLRGFLQEMGFVYAHGDTLS